MKADVIKWNLYSGRGTVKSKNAFIGFMELLHENGHELLSDYVNSKTKVLINFGCGHDPHWVSSSDYKKGVRCPRCSGVCSKQAEEEFIALLTKNNHELLSNYVNSTTKVLINFGCEHEPHWISPDSYKKGVRCPRCSGNCPKQAEEEFIALLTKNNHELLSNYVNSTTKVLINFNCGHVPHWISPGSYKSGNRCPKCYENYYKQVREEFLALLRRNNHELLSDYVNSTTKVLINFGCGHDPHWVSSSDYKKGVRCPRCSGVCSKQAEEEFIALLTKNNHELLSNYVNSTTKVLINFGCEHEPHWISPGSYKKGVRCPKCKLPKGEKIILDYLTESGINAISQYRIDGHKFRFDIYIREYNLIVEVHGRQHYEEVDFFDRRTLEEERMNDYEKEKLAVSKGYNYMAIDYKEHKPELALERFKEKFCFYETKQPKFEVIL